MTNDHRLYRREFDARAVLAFADKCNLPIRVYSIILKDPRATDSLKRFGF
jgi:hypothetical protein